MNEEKPDSKLQTFTEEYQMLVERMDPWTLPSNAREKNNWRATGRQSAVYWFGLIYETKRLDR